MKEIEKLAELGLTLPDPTVPGGNYVSVNIRGSVAYLAIQFPILNGEMKFRGVLGVDFTTEEGYHAMQLCALNALSQIHHKIGFERLTGLNHVDMYYVSTGDWDDAPKVANGASDLFVHVLGERGHHSRSIVGASDLPRDFCVGLACSLTLK